MAEPGTSFGQRLQSALVDCPPRRHHRLCAVLPAARVPHRRQRDRADAPAAPGAARRRRRHRVLRAAPAQSVRVAGRVSDHPRLSPSSSPRRRSIAAISACSAARRFVSAIVFIVGSIRRQRGLSAHRRMRARVLGRRAWCAGSSSISSPTFLTRASSPSAASPSPCSSRSAPISSRRPSISACRSATCSTCRSWC